jgi:hypothetical protein
MGTVKKNKKEEAKMEILSTWNLKSRDFEWQDDAACVGVKDIFFCDDKGSPKKRYEEAKAICGGCKVKGKCLKFANDNEFGYGVWGGKTPSERLKMLGLKRWQL